MRAREAPARRASALWIAGLFLTATGVGAMVLRLVAPKDDLADGIFLVVFIGALVLAALPGALALRSLLSSRSDPVPLTRILSTAVQCVAVAFGLAVARSGVADDEAGAVAVVGVFLLVVVGLVSVRRPGA